MPKNIYCVFFKFIESVLWPDIWSILAASFALKKVVYSNIYGWSVPQISIRSSSLIALLKSSTPLLIFCLIALLIFKRGLLKSVTMIMELSVSLALSIYNLCILNFYYLSNTNLYCYVFLGNWLFAIIKSFYRSLVILFCLKQLMYSYICAMWQNMPFVMLIICIF